jgi:DNA-binding transcriptional regulator YiaG
LPFCHAELRALKPNPSAYPKQINTLGEHIGVDGTTITNWEGNATVPAIRYMPAIIQFLGYNPLPSTGLLPERLAIARKGLGMSQRRMAEVLGVDSSTLQGWEAGQHRPSSKSLESIKEILQ